MIKKTLNQWQEFSLEQSNSEQKSDDTEVCFEYNTKTWKFFRDM